MKAVKDLRSISNKKEKTKHLSGTLEVSSVGLNKLMRRNVFDSSGRLHFCGSGGGLWRGLVVYSGFRGVLDLMLGFFLYPKRPLFLVKPKTVIRGPNLQKPTLNNKPPYKATRLQG